MDRPGAGSRLAPLVDAVRRQFPALAAVESDDDHLREAMEWLARSQDVGSTDGSAAGYNLVLGWQDPYPETSGYVIPTLYRYADRCDAPEWADRATAMAEWLVETQYPTGGVPGGTGMEGDPVVFNTGQVILGLVDAYGRTDRPEFRDAALRGADWLVARQDDDGTWSTAAYNSRHHDYHARVAWALVEAAGVAPDPGTYLSAARANLDAVVADQRPNGWFEDASFGGGRTAFLHTVAYTARGLVEVGDRLDDDGYLAAGKRTADVLLDRQTARGILRGEFDPAWNGSWYYCLPGNAQTAALWLRLYGMTGETRYLSTASGTVQFLKRHQSLTGSDPVRGGLPGSYPIFGKYVYLRYPNWGAKFLADALLALVDAEAETSRQVERIDDSGVRAGGVRAEGDGGVTVGSPQVTGETARGDTASSSDRPESADRSGTDEEACRVCLLVDGEYVDRWVAEAVSRMLAETNAEVSLVVVNDDDGLLCRGNVVRGLKYPAYALVTLGSMVRDAVSDVRSYDDQVHITEVEGVPTAPTVRTYPDQVDGLWNELPADVVERVAAESDLVVRRGFGLIRGEVLSATEHGVLSYHHGDPRAYRGGPAGFWEFLHGRDRAGAIVQRLTDELDAGVVYASTEVDIGDCDTWGEVRERLYTGSTGLLAEAVETVQDDDADPETVEDLGPVYHPPSARDLLTWAREHYRR